MSGTIDTSPAMFGRVVEALHVAYWDWIPGASHVQVSPALAELMDFDPDDWPIERFYAWVHADDRDGYRAWLIDFFKSGQRRSQITYRYVRHDGTPRWVHQHSVVERDSSGRVTRLTGTLTDVTEENEREAQNRALIARQAASIEVLRAISESPGDPQPVFDLIARRARELCGAAAASLAEFDGTLVHLRAADGFDAATAERYRTDFPRPPGSDFSHGRVLLGNQRIHTRDYANAPARFHPTSGMVTRSSLFVPLRQDGRAIGSLGVARLEAGGFDDSEVALIESFAEQASLAIAGAATLRALRTRTADLQESLEYQTATSDVLKVISRSTFDLNPVLRTLLTAAAQLCDADSGGIATTEGDGIRLATHYSRDGSHRFSLAGQMLPMTRATIFGRTTLEGRIIHVEDVGADPDHVNPDPTRPPARGTMLGVPLLRDGAVIGSIRLARDDVRPFTERQIDLVSTFADQAVIAIENTRLLTEQQEALEQQTATAEVLGVINVNPGNLAPVFDAMLERAMRLCGAAFGMLRRFDGTRVHMIASRGLPEAFAEFSARNPAIPTPSTSMGRALSSGRPDQLLDIRQQEGYETSRMMRAIAELGGARTVLTVPLVKDGFSIALFTFYRTELRGFSDKEIALLENFAAQAVIAMENARLLMETREALERQTATAEVLQVINASPGNLAPVFDAILEKALHICQPAFGTLRALDGQRMTLLAERGTTAALAAWRAANPDETPSPNFMRMIETRRPVHLLDIREGEAYRSAHPGPRAAADLGGACTLLLVPLLKEGAVVGVLQIYRQEVRAFTDNEIALLENFAAQAVIAMENARLLTETREALERQTATADVLQVINANPGDPGPVFDAILESAHRICGASIGSLWLYDGELIHAAATRGMTEQAAARMRQPRPPSIVQERMIRERSRYYHSAEHRTDDAEHSPEIAASGAQTIMGVPLVKDGRVIGLISARRLETRPFREREIELLENFAAQAVIAMENARLLTETREALEQQTATAEVLGVINANPGDLAPVFDAILEKSLRLANSAFGTLWLYDGDEQRPVAFRGMSEALAAFWATQAPPRVSSRPSLVRMTETKRSHQTLDLKDTDGYRNGIPTAVAFADLGGARTMVLVPLVKDGAVIGNFNIYRQEVRAFTDKEVALLENFAAQAVIAMENARLLGELRERTAELAERNDAFSERIDHQAATIDVLKAMSTSPGNPQPVFDLIVERARDLCDAYDVTVLEFDGTLVHHRASAGGLSDTAEKLSAIKARYPVVPTRGSPLARAIVDRKLVRIDDYDTEPDLLPRVRAGGIKSGVVIPLMRGDAVIGSLGIASLMRGGISDSQEELAKTFAEQAVIAITSAETYRALQTRTRDLQQSIEYQAATIDVLKVMSSSTNDTQPVFDAILRHAMTLSDAIFGVLWEYDGALVHMRATRGYDPERIERARRLYPRPPSHDNTVSERAILEGRLVYVRDFRDEPNIEPLARELGIGSVLAVPLSRDGETIGCISWASPRVDGFTDAHIELLKTFAEQAVIAMGTTATFRALQTRTADLQESLEYQTATSDVLKVISRSTFDLQPVLDTVVETAARLCEADMGAMAVRDGDLISMMANHGFPPEYETYQRGRGAIRLDPASPTATQRAILERQIVHLDDAAAVSGYPDAQVNLSGHRTVLGVPLLRDGEAIGAVFLARRRVDPFSDRQIELVRTFAAQAVIAMENARLLTEQREALERQTATAELLGVINASPGDLKPVFDTLLENALRMCGGTIGGIFTIEGNRSITRALKGVTPAFAAFQEQYPVDEIQPGSAPARIIDTRRPIQNPDVRASETYRKGFPFSRALVDLGNIRAVLAVPLLKEGAAVGMITLYREESGPFADKQIALLENFAAQAVIAMENARLLTETREALERQTATADVLQVINANPGDPGPVFDTILESAHRVCGASIGSLWLCDGELTYAVATRGMTEEDAAVHRRPSPMSPAQRTVLIDGARYFHSADRRFDGVELSSDIVAAGVQTVLGVPLVKDGRPIGVIGARRLEARPFADREIELLESFAAQAVIAMENARLLTEQREALEQQTATAEVLGVINASPGNLAPVFDAILEKAMRLCSVAFGSMTVRDGSQVRHVARRGHSPALEAFFASRTSWTVTPGGLPSRMFAERKTQAVLDLRNDSDFQTGNRIPRALVELGGARSFLVTPLLKDNETLGYFAFYRQEVRAFSDKEVALLENFAAQAVIAMENARLLGELRTALETTQTTLRELKIAQANLVQAEKMASLGQLTAGIAHEIKNPLNFVNNFAALSVDLLQEFKETAAPAITLLTDDQRAEIDDVSSMLTTNLRKIEEHGKRADGIVRAMLEHSRGSSGERREVDLNALVDEALNLAYHGARAQDQNFNITMERDFAAGLTPIEVNPQDLTRVFLNIFSNGFYAANKRKRESGGDEPTLRVATRAVADSVEIHIRDNGTGIPPDIRDKLFQPFFTTKPTGEGTGLGLSITYDIVTKQHGGTIAVDSEPGVFTEFTVTLPRQMFASEGAEP